MSRAKAPAIPAPVKAVIESYPPAARKIIKSIRQRIYAIARDNAAIGELEETLKWSEPAYLTSKTKSGSTVRVAWKEKSPGQVAVYLNCQTTLVDTYRSLYPELTYEGNRAVVFGINDPLPEALDHCLEMALTYHLDKSRG